ncbi:hypothetical protein GCM10012275_30340 [Longimycelium tulufanense]|uniref:Transposase n=2 Tax=Longimycelium tulufanense TaxID=907463 RepID=A0A8J3C8Q4_9PSEU|nr:hypothetical protein GCM10012275_30340 [Longimycelium tulufanense]
MAGIRIRRAGGGRPRTRPGSVLADKAYANRAVRLALRRRRITAVIPEPADQVRNRKAKDSRGGRPPMSTPPCTSSATPPSAAPTSSAAWLADGILKIAHTRQLGDRIPGEIQHTLLPYRTGSRGPPADRPRGQATDTTLASAEARPRQAVPLPHNWVSGITRRNHPVRTATSMPPG